MTHHDQGEERGKLTGRHVLFIFLAFFGTIFAVNGFMAFQAVGTFPGLEAKNGFVESQSFEARRSAQEALGWEVGATLEDGVLAIAFTDEAGAPVEVAGMEAVVGRATHVEQDRMPEFTYRLGTFRTPMELEPGNWNIRLTAHAPDGTPFERRIVLRVPG
jgi:nitrogen fixation protein FixH